MDGSENQRYEDGLTMQSLLNLLDRINSRIESCEESHNFEGQRTLETVLAMIELEITRQRRAPNLKRMY